MGFLFDEDMVESQPGGQGRSQALELWGGLMGELEATTASGVGPDPLANQIAEAEAGIDPASSATGFVPAVTEELLLDDVATVELPEISLELEDQLETVAPKPPVKPLPPSQPVPKQQLSKFRNAPPPTAEKGGESAGSNSGGSALGRIPLVRVKRDGTKRVPYLARLLSSF